MYDEAVVGKFNLMLNDRKPYSGMPYKINLSESAFNLFQIYEKSEQNIFEGYVLTCVCGVKECAKVKWRVKQKGGKMNIEMSDNLDNEHGVYSVDKKDYLKELSSLLTILIDFTSSRGISEVNGRDVDIFQEKIEKITDLRRK